ncbi:MAG: T9SS type A sorting domain-containing protein [Candidatus Kapaibacterium sp.]
MSGARLAGAQTWTKVHTFDGYICLAKFLDENTGFVGLGVSPGRVVDGPSPIELYKTTDGGKTWIKATIPSGYGGDIGDLLMVDSMNGWLAMTVYGGSGNKALWRTSDGGLTWNETQLVGSGTAVQITPAAMTVTDIFNEVHVSTDKGNTFTNGFMNSTNDVNFTDPLHGVITVFHGNNWLNTSDGGVTWQSLGIGYESWSVYADSGTPNFYAAPELSNNIFRSTDYGATWGSVAQFPFVFTGHLTGIGDQHLFFQVDTSGSYANGIQYEGFYYSSDKGVSWTSIGGLCAFNDTRFSVLNECSGITVFGFDCLSPGTLYRYNFGSGNNGPAVLSVSGISKLVPRSCSAADTSVPIAFAGCVSSPTLDSLWLTGSQAFTITDTRGLPRSLAASDSILLQFSSTGAEDTTYLHMRYNLGSGTRDTAILLTGMPSPLTANSQRLHREAGSAYFGQLDSLRMGVDIDAAVNLDSLWPYVSDIQATFAFDSSVVQFQSYIAPIGWSLRSFTNKGNSIDFGIHNISSVASNPLDLGMALFSPNGKELATTWVTLPRLVIDAGGQAISLCVTDNEDSHWSVKTLGAESGVAEAPTVTGDGISIYPNPAESEFFVRNTNAHPALITLYDAIGRNVASANVGAASTSTIDIAQLVRGSYVVVCQVGDRIVARRLDKSR